MTNPQNLTGTKHATLTLCTLTALAVVPAALPRAAHAQDPAPSAEAQATYADIKKTLGLVPSFLRAFPEEAIAPAWDEFKAVQLNPSSAIPPKYKELIGLAVSAQIPCRYCIYFHTKAAGLGGATTRPAPTVTWRRPWAASPAS